ncbi:MAG: MFS transporter [Bacteroidales bacterium]|jgi:DHA3 family macrolide efflux protein-like MFS transporter|nr:MFS transporter [Bacteroidales bacterium]
MFAGNSENGYWKRNVALFLGGQSLTLIGSSLVQYAIIWYVTLRTGSGVALTAFTVVAILPMFFISPFAGVWADRFNRKTLINISDGAIAIVTLFIAICFIVGYQELWLLWLCAGVRAIGQGVQMPAVNAFLPSIVPQEHYMRINGINNSIQSFSTLISPMLAGVILSFMPITAIFFIDIFTAIAGISILYFFVLSPKKTKEMAEEKNGINYFQDIKAGIKYMLSHRWLVWMLVIFAIYYLCFAPLAFLTTLKVVRDYGGEIWKLTANELVFSIGMILGGLIMSWWGGFKNRMYSMGLSNVLVGLSTILIGIVPNFLSYLIVMGLLGLFFPLLNVPFTSLVQEKIDASFMGRVFSVIGMLSSVLMPLSMVIFGPMSDFISLDILLIFTGAIIVVIAFPFFISSSLRKAGKS